VRADALDGGLSAAASIITARTVVATLVGYLTV
jgi:hypothetical protein